MGLPLFADMVVTVVEPGTKTVNGSTRPDWANPVSVRVVEGCWVYPAATVEDVAARQANMVGQYVLLPGDTPVPSEQAKFTLPDGLDYQAQGKPKPQPSIHGDVDHIAAYVERWEG